MVLVCKFQLLNIRRGLLLGHCVHVFCFWYSLSRILFLSSASDEAYPFRCTSAFLIHAFVALIVSTDSWNSNVRRDLPRFVWTTFRYEPMNFNITDDLWRVSTETIRRNGSKRERVKDYYPAPFIDDERCFGGCSSEKYRVSSVYVSYCNRWNVKEKYSLHRVNCGKEIISAVTNYSLYTSQQLF